MITNENERRVDTTLKLKKRIKALSIIWARDKNISLSRLVEKLLLEDMGLPQEAQK